MIQWHLLVQARVATDAATKSADAAQRQLEAIDRAWIYAELPVIESCTLHPQGVRFDVRFTFKNVGRAVARHISYSATLMVLTAHGGNIVRQIVDQIEGEGRIQCERAPQSFKEMGTPGPTLFPGETGGPRKADDLRVENSRIEAGAEQLPEDTRRSWEPTIVGCVVYLLPNSQTMHHTRFSYVIRKETLDKIGNPLPLGVGENVTAKDLVLMPLGMVGTDAD
ncbi:MAG: hypothetical protein LAO05_18090 [Acidobacteriia bacterium]|nr:hypothetical protein [Terriglobia bacterium]